MSTIVTRAGKGSPLTNNEVDANFVNLNTDKVQVTGTPTTGQAIIWNGTAWVPGVSGSGDVSGPVSSTDNAVARFDGTTGALIQNSTATLSDTGALATANVTSDYYAWNTGAGVTPAVGQRAWDANQGTTALGLLGGNVITRDGQSLVAYVTNAEAVTITKGQAVYLFSAVGDRASVKLAYNTGDATSAKTLGIVAEDIAAGQAGFVMCQGVAYKMDTSAYTAGDSLYLGATAGSLTTTKPYAPNHLVYIGTVEKANAGNGQIYVRVQNGYELDELHNVAAQSPTNGQTLVYNSTNSLWEKSFAPVISDTTIDNTTIGATTPSTGVFTTLTATGTSNLGTGSSAYLQVTGGSGNVNLDATASTGNVDVRFSSRASGNIIFRTAGGTTQAQVSHTASAVNYVQVTGAATGVTPIVGVDGSDSQISLLLRGKGSAGGVTLGTSFGNYFRAVGGAGITTVNNLQAQGSATTFAPVLSAQGSDTNISQVFQSKGTGAIDLAAGSSGVNISNGGTVTAITRTANGSYTSMPTAVISAPTTAGGTQATLSPLMAGSTATVVAGGTGYTVGDTLTIVGATGTPSQFTVATLSGSAVATVTFTTSGSMSALPSNPVSVTGGTGSGATFNMTYSLAATQSSFTAGSGYVEQPTVTFSGGGGSGATAFATIGSATSFKSLSDLTINLPSGPVLSMTDSSLPGTGAYLNLSNGSTSSVISRAVGTNTNLNFYWLTKGTGLHSFNTNNSTTTQQFVVSHTASAVNYVQVTGAATTGLPVISAQGSDTNIAMYVTSKGNGTIRFATNNSAQTQLRVSHTTSAVNFVDVTGSASGAAPIISVAGNDTNIDLALTTKGTGGINLNTGNGTQFRVADTTAGGTAVNYIQTAGNIAGASPRFISVGADTNVGIVFSSKGTGDLSFRTNGTNQTQFLVSHTASAVNYVQVTGSATAAYAQISAQGSDTNPGILYTTKGTGEHRFSTAASITAIQFRVRHINSPANYCAVIGAPTGSAPEFQTLGTDTNIDLALTPKGTGNVIANGGLRLTGSTSGYVGLKAAATAGSTTYTLPSADGTSGQVLSTDGAGTLSWATGGGGGGGGSGTSTSRTSFTATAAQTTFTVSYVVGQIDVYMNGSKLLIGTDVTASNGTSIVLASGAAAGDIIEAVVYSSQWTTSGSDIYYNTGNVGVGTSSPYSKINLAWNSSAGINNGLFGTVNNSAGANNGYRIGLKTASDSSNWAAIDQAFYNLSTDARTYIAFSTTDNSNTLAERARIDYLGNLGVGTTSPSTTDGTGARFVSSGNAGGLQAIFSDAVNYTIGVKRSGASGSVGMIYGTSGTALALGANNAEAARIDSAGRLLVGLTSANTSGGVLQVSNGITFPATQSASSDANTLDDYEEGTWTPTITPETGSFTTTSYTSANCTYVKIGKQVVCNIRWQIDSFGTGAGGCKISGLPFAIGSSQRGSSSGLNGSNSWALSSLVYSDGNYVSFYKYDGTFTSGDFQGKSLVATITYFV